MLCLLHVYSRYISVIIISIIVIIVIIVSYYCYYCYYCHYYIETCVGIVQPHRQEHSAASTAVILNRSARHTRQTRHCQLQASRRRRGLQSC